MLSTNTKKATVKTRLYSALHKYSSPPPLNFPVVYSATMRYLNGHYIPMLGNNIEHGSAHMVSRASCVISEIVVIKKSVLIIYKKKRVY